MIGPVWRQAMALAVVGLGALTLVFEQPGLAQDAAPPKRAARDRAPGDARAPSVPTGSIRVENRDSTTLVSLLLSNDGLDPDVVAQGVPSGTWVVVALPHPDVCIYDVEARLADWSYVDLPQFDLCKDQTLNVGDSLPAASIKPYKDPNAPPPAPAVVAKAEPPHPASEEKQPVASKTRIRIENNRHSTLLSLLLTNHGASPHLVAQLVASGASVTAELPEAGKCVYDAQVEFADNYGTSYPGHDFCKDPTIKFNN